MSFMHKLQALKESALKFTGKLPLASALRERLKHKYTLAHFKADLLAGFVVGMVAIPLGMALAIAIGVPPQYGLYTVMMGGIVSLLGGSRFSVTGPTAAFVVILAPIVSRYGLGGLLLASLISGILIFFLGLSRLGQVIRFIPYPVTTGFTSGIAVVIATIQIKDFFGLKIDHVPDHFFEKIGSFLHHAPTFSLYESLIAFTTLILLVVWPKINKRIPSPLVVLSSMTLLVTFLNKYFPNLSIATIRERFTSVIDGQTIQGIPSSLPKFDLPWNFMSGDSLPFSLDYTNIQALIMAGLSIAILGAIETLLCAVVADGITQTNHDSDSELLALGIGNILGPFFGAIPSTGAIVRTATNIRFGARSPLAAVFHSLFVLLTVIFAAEYVSYMPMASLAALLVYVAYGMFDAKHFFHCLDVSPRSDKLVLLSCFFLTVIFDMVIGVGVGVILAALLFIQRMTDLTSGTQWVGEHHKIKEKVPDGIMVYDIAGPLFFGVAQRAVAGVRTANEDIKIVIFNLELVPILDLTGLIAFESAILELISKSVSVYVAASSPQPLRLLKQSKVFKDNSIPLHETLHDSLVFAKETMATKYI